MPRLIDAEKLPRMETVNDANAIDNAQIVQAFGKWISVKERMPGNGQNILVLSAKTGTQYVSHKDLIYFDPDGNACVPTSYLQTFVFTHWMPLPCSLKESGTKAGRGFSPERMVRKLY